MNRDEREKLTFTAQALDADISATFNAFQLLDRQAPRISALLRDRYGIQQKFSSLAAHLSDLAALLQEISEEEEAS